MPSAHCERASEGLQSFADHPRQFEPETQYRYSTFGWILVSAAIEADPGSRDLLPLTHYSHRISKEDYRDAVHQQILGAGQATA